MSASIARVLVESPLPQLDRLFDYSIPEEFSDSAKPGVRVTVPMRSEHRKLNGFIVDLVEASEFQGKLSPISMVLSPIRVLTENSYQLARKLADRAAGNASDVLRLSIPSRQARVESTWKPKEQSPSKSSPVPISNYESAKIEKAIQNGGRLALEATPGMVQLGDNWIGKWANDLVAIASVGLQSGSVIIAVPDYRDIEQVVTAVEELIPHSGAVRLDSKQSESARYASFLSCLTGKHQLIVGNRSAVYAPVSDLALTIIWNDGDPLFSEPLAPYVHCRDATLVRQEIDGGAILTASFVQSVAISRLVQIGWFEEVVPLRRASPKVVLTSAQPSEERLAAIARIPTFAWQEVSKALALGPVLVQTAQPGYVRRLYCERCEEPLACNACGGALGLEARGSTPSCRVCGAIFGDWICPNCNSKRFRMSSLGAERTAEDLGKGFPGVQVLVADGERQVLNVKDRPCLVIATRGAEPIAEGGYRAVLLLDGERMLSRTGLDTEEDCLRNWASAASLARLDASVILVGVGGAIASSFATWDLSKISISSLADRAKLRFPPMVRVAAVTGSTVIIENLIGELKSIQGVDVLGPMPLAEPGSVRIIVRFDYSRGADVAKLVRTSVIRASIESGASNRKSRTRAVNPQHLKVHFDDVSVFDFEGM